MKGESFGDFTEMSSHMLMNAVITNSWWRTSFESQNLTGNNMDSHKKGSQQAYIKLYDQYL